MTAENLTRTAAIASVLATIASAVFGHLALRARYENARLKSKLRIALTDCLAFYRVEEIWCNAIAELAKEKADQPSALAIKRRIRNVARLCGIPTPSEDATPKKIAEELEKLS